MSDLRDQLIEAARSYLLSMWHERKDPDEQAELEALAQGNAELLVAAHVWPLVEAALTKARQQGREEAARDIELASPSYGPQETNFYAMLARRQVSDV